MNVDAGTDRSIPPRPGAIDTGDPLVDGAQARMSVALGSRDLVVRYVSFGDGDESTLARVLPQLPPGEQAHAVRFHFVRDRLAFTLGRILLRSTLSHYERAPAGGWQFVWNSHGKPELTPSPDRQPFRFNISHCAGLVTVGFALGRDIGVDVEPVDRCGAGVEIAHSCFAPDEVRMIVALPEAQRHTAFVSIWTLKEAYVKARGLGLSIPLADFSIALDPPRISFSPRLVDDEHWFLWQHSPSPGHVLAVAARRRPDEQLRVCLQEVALECLI